MSHSWTDLDWIYWIYLFLFWTSTTGWHSCRLFFRFSNALAQRFVQQPNALVMAQRFAQQRSGLCTAVYSTAICSTGDLVIALAFLLCFRWNSFLNFCWVFSAEFIFEFLPRFCLRFFFAVLVFIIGAQVFQWIVIDIVCELSTCACAQHGRDVLTESRLDLIRLDVKLFRIRVSFSLFRDWNSCFVFTSLWNRIGWQSGFWSGVSCSILFYFYFFGCFAYFLVLNFGLLLSTFCFRCEFWFDFIAAIRLSVFPSLMAFFLNKIVNNLFNVAILCCLVNEYDGSNWRWAVLYCPVTAIVFGGWNGFFASILFTYVTRWARDEQ